MKLASSFSVPAAPDKVMALFLDPGTMQACIPGCEELSQTDETHYAGTLVNEVAHVRFKAGFTAEITSSAVPEDAPGPAVVTALLKGEDRRLGSTIKVEATLTVEPRQGGEASEVSYELELAMWGKLGRLGESVIRRRTQEVERQFAEALTAVCSGQPVPVREERGRRRGRSAAPDTTAGTTAETSGTAGSTATSASGDAASTGAITPDRPAAVAPASAERPREDWVVLGLAVAGAFAYGILFGRRGGRG